MSRILILQRAEKTDFPKRGGWISLRKNELHENFSEGFRLYTLKIRTLHPKVLSPQSKNNCLKQGQKQGHIPIRQRPTETKRKGGVSNWCCLLDLFESHSPCDICINWGTFIPSTQASFGCFCIFTFSPFIEFVSWTFHPFHLCNVRVEPSWERETSIFSNNTNFLSFKIKMKKTYILSLKTA